ncbi:MAG: hypothetical protein JXA20_10095 [Spirochaetes bacterium]|nr:hypothetical protein [Spirochaetota bacterium]
MDIPRNAASTFVHRLLVDHELVELDMLRQRFLLKLGLILGLPLCAVLCLYGGVTGDIPLAVFTLLMFCSIAVALAVGRCAMEERRRYAAVKALSVLPWAYLIPVASLFILGGRLSVPILTIIGAGVVWAVFSVPFDILLHRRERDLLVWLLAALPVSCAVVSLAYVIVRRHQRFLIWNKETLEETEDRYREYSENLAREVGERKRYEQELKKSLDEKEMLLRELHHRVKNNLQVVSSLLNLEGMKTEDPVVMEFLDNSQGRIKTMQMVHEMLYASHEVSRIDLGAFLEKIVYSVKHSFDTGQCRVDVTVLVEESAIDIESAIPCGLIVNEIATNAMKHAFAGRYSGALEIRFDREGPWRILRIADNGIGMTPGMENGSSRSLGMTLINSLVKQLRGEMDISTDRGTAFTIRFGENSRLKVYPA